MNFRPLILLLVGLVCTIPHAGAQVLNRSGEDSTIFVSHAVFLPKESMNSGDQNWCIASADLNWDGLQDILVGSKLDGMVHVHLGEGNGKFSHGGEYATRQHNRAIEVFDANGDGELDVATVTMKGELCLLRNSGQGKFSNLKVMVVGSMLQDVAATDVDGDGDQDLLVAATGINQVIWYRNEGNFNFAKAAAWATGKDPRSLALGDLNGDQQADLVVGCDDGKIYLFAGESNGFSKWGKFSSGAANWAVTIADFNQDGKNDIATASYLDKWLSIHLNQGSLGFPISQQILSGDHNFDIVVSDFDLDGDLDIATCSTLDKEIGFHLNDGTGEFSRRFPQPSGDWNAGMIVADVDQDGDPDLVVASINDHQVHIHRNISINPKKETPKDFICLHGFVIDGDNNKKLPGTPVSLRRDRDNTMIATTIADEKGQFEFCKILPGAYTLIARSPGFPTGEQAFTMPENNFQQDVVLGKAPATFIYGLVTDAVSRERLIGAQVDIRNSDGVTIFQLSTDARGRYKTAIDPGEFTLIASLEGYESSETTASVLIENGEAGTRVDLTLTPMTTDACLSGVVYNEETNEILPHATIAIRDEAGNPVRKIRSNEKGAYRVCLPFGEYQFSSTATGFFFKVENVSIQEPDPETPLTHDIYLKPLKENAHIVLEHIYFDVDKAILRPESIEELERVVEILTQNPSLVVSIEGHTDSDASDAHNLSLSDRRSGAVVNYLKEAGISPARLLYEGFGESRPIAPNDSPENKQLNRRTEFRVVEF
ncbi:MAG: FG-GAP-like repeat-containing protein [Bacteroidia bacterium]|nr:FG-GAP-like repeat-containing protein [Bacteroidia bacterium]